MADLIEGSYRLEISSPGLDRALVRRSDFNRYAGHLAQRAMQVPIEGLRRFRGELSGAEGDSVRLRLGEPGAAERPEVLLRIDEVAEAKLVLTEALVAEALRRSKRGERDAPQQDADARPPRHHQKHLDRARGQASRMPNPRETDDGGS